MASASSSAARLLAYHGKSATSLLFRGRAANLTETVHKTRPAIRSLLRFNQTPPSQYPAFSETFPVMQSGFPSCFIHEEAVSERRWKMEAGQGNRMVNNECSASEEETDFDEEEFDDIEMDDDAEFDDTDEEEGDDEEDEEEEEDEQIVKKKKK